MLRCISGHSRWSKSVLKMLFLDSQEKYVNPGLVIQAELALLLISQVSACSNQQCQHKHKHNRSNTYCCKFFGKILIKSMWHNNVSLFTLIITENQQHLSNFMKSSTLNVKWQEKPIKYQEACSVTVAENWTMWAAHMFRGIMGHQAWCLIFCFLYTVRRNRGSDGHFLCTKWLISHIDRWFKNDRIVGCSSKILCFWQKTPENAEMCVLQLQLLSIQNRGFCMCKAEAEQVVTKDSSKNSKISAAASGRFALPAPAFLSRSDRSTPWALIF